MAIVPFKASTVQLSPRILANEAFWGNALNNPPKMLPKAVAYLRLNCSIAQKPISAFPFLIQAPAFSFAYLIARVV